jgi:urate oxidase
MSSYTQADNSVIVATDSGVCYSINSLINVLDE